VLFKGETYPSFVEEVAALTAIRDVILAELRDNLLQAQQDMKRFADKKRKEVFLAVGDWVYLKMQPYRMRSLAKRPNKKLSPRFYGPFEVIQKIGVVAFKSALPQGCRLHPIFHITRLKKTVPPTQQGQSLPLSLIEGELLTVPSQVLSSRVTPDDSTEYRIH